MSDTPRCPKCAGHVVIAHPFSTSEPINICIACSPPKPTTDELLAELNALLSQSALTRATSFALLQEGEAVLPSSWTSTITTLRPEWMRSTTSDRLAICRAASS